MQATRLKPRPYVGTELTTVLNKFRDQTTKTLAAIAADSWLSESYVSRLFSGERVNPSRDALITLVLVGMDLSVPDAEEILFAAGYRSLVQREYSA